MVVVKIFCNYPLPLQTTSFLMMKPSQNTDVQTTDHEIWCAFRKGSEEALALIYHQHIRALFNYGIKIVQDEDLVEDSIQEMYVDLWKRRSFLNDTTSIKFYLFKALKRKIIRKISKKKTIHTEGQIEEDYAFQVVFSCESVLIREELNHEQKERIEKALACLTHRQKEVIYLKFYDHLSYEQIASIMKIDKSAVYSLIFKSVNKLRKYFLKTQLYSTLDLFPLLATLTFLF